MVAARRTHSRRPDVESFARIHTTGKVTTSQKKRVKDGFSGRTLLANTAVGVTLRGFITQLFGLQATHSSVIVLHLVAILVMMALRSYAHSNRNRRNHIADPHAVREYELDWLTKSLGGCFGWEVRHLPSHNNIEPTAGNPTSSLQPGVSQSALGLTPATPATRPAPPTFPPTGETSTEEPPIEPQAGLISPTESMPHIEMRIRTSLAELSDDRDLSSRTTVAALQEALEGTINDVFAKMNIKEEYQNKELFEWRVPVTAKQTVWEGKEELPGPDEEHEVSLSLTRKRDETGSLGDWVIDKSKREAIFCLWVLSLEIIHRTQARNNILRPKHIRLLGPATYALQVDYKL